MYTNVKIRIHPVNIYLLKVNNKNSRTRCVIYSKLTKKTPEGPHWHEDINKNWHHSIVSVVNFEKIPHLFLVFHSWILGSVAGWVYQQRSKYREVEIMKHAMTDTNYATKLITKQVKLQQEKKPVSSLISMQSLGFEQTWNLLRFSFHKYNFITGKRL